MDKIEEFNNKIGNRIKEARKSRSLSAVELAKLSGFSPQRISNWERGVRTLGMREARILSAHLGVDATWLTFMDLKPKLEETKYFSSIPLFDFGNAPFPGSEQNNSHLPLPLEIKMEPSIFFALKIIDESMSPTYKSGDIVTFTKQQNKSTSHPFLALVIIKSTQEVLFRKVIIENNTSIILSPINDEWPVATIKKLSGFDIIGVTSNGPAIYL